jgi:hypothetical protein
MEALTTSQKSFAHTHHRIIQIMAPRDVKEPALLERAKALKNTPWCDEYERMISGML